MKTLRKHQADGLARARQIVDGIETGKFTVAHVTPGGGKSLLASIFGHELVRGGIVKRVSILCPRDSLRSQMRGGFTDSGPFDGLDLSLTIEAEGNKAIEGQTSMLGSVGIVTTYQSVAARPKRLLRRFQREPHLLVLDEPHHLAGPEEDEASEEYAMWVRAVEPLVKAATHVLLMTGTLYRSDGRRIPFVEYDEKNEPVAHIRYTRQDALDEGAILRTEFRLWNGRAQYHYRGESHDMDLNQAPEEEQSRAVRTALLDIDGYVRPFLLSSLADWLEYRKAAYRSTAIVVCHTQASARQVAQIIRETLGVEVALAISDEPRAGRVVQRFRDGIEGDVLVTVGMAYEGLDVPAATHLVCLSNRRARPWLEQAFARVTRVNQKCSVPAVHQHAFVYAPDDPKMRKFIDEVLEEQRGPVDDVEPKSGPVAIAARGRSTFVPVSCDIGEQSVGADGQMYSPDLIREARALRDSIPEFASMPLHRVIEVSTVLRQKAEADRAS
jgi:superfamily II DNA or RNA helicase